MLKVDIKNFSYANKQIVLKEIKFSLKPGEHLCVMGESGCGKSTLLKAIYGLLNLTQGTIYWKKQQVLGPAHNLVPGYKKFKYVAQDFDLMPYTSVVENIQKFLSRFYPEESKKRTQELLEVIEMTAFANTKVKNLSGGQQQRVAIARALAKEPELLLLDEPFGQIDNFKKNSLRRRLFAYLKQKNIACIVATHEKNDALSFADSLVIIKNNTILENNTPAEIYKHPKNKYIATLFDDVNELYIQGTPVLLYPHQLKITNKPNENTLTVEVFNCYFKGCYWLIEVMYKQQNLYIKHTKKILKHTLVSLEINFEP